MAIESHINTRNIESTPWQINGQLNGVELNRLAGISQDKQVLATIELTLSREAKNEIRISGQVKAEFTAVCQRCLQNYTCKLSIDLNEIFTEKNTAVDDYHYEYKSSDEENIENDYFNKEGLFSLLYYIEDEILLAVPAFPAHPEIEDCDAEMITRLEKKAYIEEHRENPFAVLKKLK